MKVGCWEAALPCHFERRRREGGHDHIVCRHCGFRALGSAFINKLAQFKKEEKAAAKAVKAAVAAAKKEGAAAGRKEAVRALAQLQTDAPQTARQR